MCKVVSSQRGEKRARKVLRSTACCRFVGRVTVQSQQAVLLLLL